MGIGALRTFLGSEGEEGTKNDKERNNPEHRIRLGRSRTLVKVKKNGRSEDLPEENKGLGPEAPGP
jgi:hypothetical protein